MQSAAEILRALPTFRHLTDWQRDSLARCAHRSMFHAGNRIFRENEPADRMWLIVSGRVEVDAADPERGDVVIDVLGPGEALGWSWMFPPYRWHFGARAVENTLTVELDGPQVRELCQRDPALGYQFSQALMQIMTSRLQATRRRYLGEPGRPPETATDP